MPSLLGPKIWFLVLWICLGVPHGVAASETAGAQPKPTLDVKHSSTPIWDPEVIDKQQIGIGRGPFFFKIQQERAVFQKKKLKRRRKFLTKVRTDTQISPEARQKKLAKFYQKELERERKFLDKQNEILRKHYRKRQEKQGKRTKKGK